MYYSAPTVPWQRSPLVAEGLLTVNTRGRLSLPDFLDQDAVNDLLPTNQCRDIRSASSVEQEWLLSDVTDHFFNFKMRSQRSYAIWVIIFCLLCSQACFGGNIFQDSHSFALGNDSVIFNLLLFPLRDAPGCSPICPFDSHTHKLTHARTFTNNYDLCNSHLFLWEVRKPDFACKVGDSVQIVSRDFCWIQTYLRDLCKQCWH